MRLRDDLNWFPWAAGLLFIGCGTGLSQQMQHHGDAAMHTIQQPFNIETFDAFQQMMRNGDFTAKIKLDAAMAKHPTTGIGAVAGARGEITIYDGKLIVSYGKPSAAADASTDRAAQLAMGSATQWQSVPDRS